MIFKLKTSKKTAEIFEEIGKSTSLKPYTLVKHAIAWSLRDGGKATKFMPSILMCPIYNKETAKQGNHIKEAFSVFDAELDSSSVLFNSQEYKVAEKNWHYRYHPFKVSVNGKVLVDESVIDFKHYFSVPMSYLINNRNNRLFQLDDLFAEQITLKFAAFLTRVPIPE